MNLDDFPEHAEPLLRQVALCTSQTPKTGCEMNKRLWEAFNAGRDYQKILHRAIAKRKS